MLVLLFHDFLQPLTILMALPLSLGGALLPLVLTGTSFSMPAVIGLLMLMGVVTKNSILLVEYAIISRRAGLSRFEALVDACHKRARPIVMTTIAMGGGMLPIALSLSGGDPSFRQPMAIVVIGGLITSTVLSLVVIPSSSPSSTTSFRSSCGFSDDRNRLRRARASPKFCRRKRR